MTEILLIALLEVNLFVLILAWDSVRRMKRAKRELDRARRQLQQAQNQFAIWNLERIRQNRPAKEKVKLN